MPECHAHRSMDLLPEGAAAFLLSGGDLGRSILNLLVAADHHCNSLIEEVAVLRERLKLAASLKYGRKRESFFDTAQACGQVALAFLQLASVEIDVGPANTPTPSQPDAESGTTADLGSQDQGDAATPPPDNGSKGGKGKRKKTPTDLSQLERRVVAVIPVADDQVACPCCKDTRRVMTITESTRLAFQRAKFFLEVTQREVRVCDECDGQIVRAPNPLAHLGRAKAAPSLRAQLIVSKLGFGIPTYRFLRMLADGTGTVITPASVDRWIAESLDMLGPLGVLSQKSLVECGLVSLDDSFGQTLIPVNLRKNQAGKLDPNGRTTENGRMWFLLGDVDQIAYVHYTSNWKASNLATLLPGFKGQLQGDAYAGYRGFCSKRGLNTPAGCMDHARRGFDHAKRAGNPLAQPILAIFAKLYQVEEEAKRLDITGAEKLRKWRDEHSKPIFEELSRRIHELHGSRHVRDLLSKATRYFIRQEAHLRVYLSDGRVPLSNIHVERMIRIYAVMRSACKQMGSPAAATRMGDGPTLVVNAILAGVSLGDYFTWLFEDLPGTPKERLAELLPRAYAQRTRSLPLAIAG